eukprot:jgi/Pico_ML_1/52150/g2908.t1
MAESTVWNNVKPYINGGSSGMMATCCIQPLDMVKVRIQLGMTGSPFGIASHVIKTEGVGALYRGFLRSLAPGHLHDRSTGTL